jgi:glycosyltransferase involved in cell wall biosynthesis
MAFEPLLSVVIPVFNAEQWLASCVKSVNQGMGDDLEIIIVDDGSTDDSPRICDDLSRNDARIKVAHTGNGGVSAARNQGIELATGTFILCVDADDRLLPGSLRALCQVLERTTSDVLMFDYAIQDLEEKKIQQKPELHNGFPPACTVSGEKALSWLFANRFGCTVWQMIARRRLYIESSPKIQFPVGMAISEDYLTVVKLLCNAEKVTFIRQVAYIHNERESSALHRARQIPEKMLFAVADVTKAEEEVGLLVRQYHPSLMKEFYLHQFRHFFSWYTWLSTTNTPDEWKHAVTAKKNELIELMQQSADGAGQLGKKDAFKLYLVSHDLLNVAIFSKALSLVRGIHASK